MAEQTFPSQFLQSDGIVLRALTAADVAAVAEYCTDEVIQTWLPLPRPFTEDAARWFCTEFASRQLADGHGLVLGIDVEERLAGVIDLKKTDWRARTTEIGYWTAPWARRRGVMRRSLSLLSRWAIETQDFARVEVRVAIGNVASQKVAEAAGFTREGILRNAGYIHTGRVDLIVYSIVDSDRSEL